MSDESEVKCAQCNLALQSEAVDPKSDDILVCPSCGAQDTVENVIAEVKDYVMSQAGEHLFDSAKRSARDSKFITVSREERPKKSHRFIVDLDL